MFQKNRVLLSCLLTAFSLNLVQAADPDTPVIVAPLDEVGDVAINVTLSWQESDSDGDIASREVHYGTVSGALTEVADPTGTSLTLNDLEEGTTYYWQVVVIDTANNQTQGPEWSFTTEDYAVDLGGLRAWYRPEELMEDNVGAASGTSLAEWRDATGLQVMSQSNASYQPSYAPELLNGYSVAYYDGNGDRTNSGYTHDNSEKPLTISVVYAIRGLNNSGNYANGVVYGRGNRELRIGSEPGYSYYSASDGGNRLSTGSEGAIAYEKDRFVIHTFRYDPAISRCEHWVNGSYQGYLNIGSNYYAGIGLGRSDDPNHDANAYVAEFMVYEKTLSNTDIGEIEVYLADKYGLYHPDATWIVAFDLESQGYIHVNRLNRDEFMSDTSYGTYNSDVDVAPWITSYGPEQQAYIHAKSLNLSDVPLPPGDLQHTYGLTNGLILFMPLRGNESEISLSQLAISEPISVPFNQVDRFGVSNNAPYFSGTNGFHSSLTNKPKEAMTISVWAKQYGISASAAFNVIIGTYDGSQSDDATFLMSLYGSDGYSFQAFNSSVNSWAKEAVPALDSPTRDQWTSVVARYGREIDPEDPNSSRYGSELYLDNTPRGIVGVHVGDIRENSEPIGIGAENAQINRNLRSFNGAMNDLMVWDRALSDEELELLYFIQMDKSNSQQFQSLISGVIPNPVVSGLKHGEVLLDSGDVIDLQLPWSVTFDVAVELDRVEFYLDDNFLGHFQKIGSDYFFDEDFAVTSGLRTMKVLAYNKNGFSHEYIIDLNFSSNTAPYFDPALSNDSIEENEIWSLTLSAADAETNQTLTSALVSGPTGLTFDPITSILAWQPLESNGGNSYQVKVSVTDNGVPNLTTEASFDLRVIEVIDFVDPILETRLLSLFSGKTYLTEDDLASLTGTLDLSRLQVEDPVITDLSGLQYATGITGLNLSENGIVDISPLAGLSQLTSLDLSDNLIDDPASLVSLMNLVTLNLSGNRLDLDDVAGDVSILNALPATVDTANQARYTLQWSTTGPGAVTAVVPYQMDYGYNTSVTLTPTPSETFDQFESWSGDVSGSDSPLNITITNDTTVVANFIHGVTAGNGDGLILDSYKFNSSNHPSIENSNRGIGYRAYLWDVSGLIGGNDLPNWDYYFSHIEGQIEAQYTDTYTFSVTDDDAAWVYLDGVLIVGDSAGSTPKYSEPIPLVAGNRYDLKIVFKENGGSQYFNVYWQNSVETSHLIPMSQLYSGLNISAGSTPTFGSPVVATYFESDGVTPFVSSGTTLEYGTGTLPVNAKVVLTASTASDVIRYTTDGSEPDATSARYRDPITISESTVLLARAFNEYPGALFRGVYTTDTSSPTLSSPELPNTTGGSATEISVGDAINRSIAVLAGDNTAVHSVSFSLTPTDEQGGATGSSIDLGTDESGEAAGSTDSEGNVQYRFSVPFDIFQFADGDWILDLVAEDSVGNVTEATFSISIAITAPTAPAIITPVDSDPVALFSNGQISVSGSARKDSQVQFEYRIVDSGGLEVTSWASIGSFVPVSANGNFATTLTFNDNATGENYEIRTYARGRAPSYLISPSSDTVSFIVDSSVPAAPTNTQVQALPDGLIRITWSPATGYLGIITSYRIEMKLDGVWTTLVDVSAAATSYTYDPDGAAGPFQFRVSAVRELSDGQEITSVEDELQVSASVLPDAILPSVSTWSLDPEATAYGTGFVDIRLTASEPLKSTPYLTLAPANGGLPVPVNLLAVDSQNYEGSFAIDASQVNGAYHANFVLYDLAGNKAEVSLNNVLTIDTEAPSLINITPDNPLVFKNVDGSTLNYQFEFDEPLDPDASILAAAEWGDSNQAAPSILLEALGSGVYQVSVTFDTLAGYDGSSPSSDPDEDQQAINDAVLYITVESTDTLGNTGVAEIPGVLVYRNQLPGPKPPVLSVSAQEAGSLSLSWNTVENADRYQLVGLDTSNASVVLNETQLAGPNSYEFEVTLPSGSYEFYVYGQREDSGATGGYVDGFESNHVTITSDDVPPSPVTAVNLVDEVPNSVLKLTWDAPSGDLTDLDHYEVYRTTVVPLDVATAKAGKRIQGDIGKNASRTVYDTKPFAGLVYYTVLTVDAVGNASLSTVFPDRDISVVPPPEVEILFNEDSLPILSWTAVDAITNGGSYSVYYQPKQSGAEPVLLASDLTTTSFEDVTWSSGRRTYIVESVKNGNAARRDIIFPGYGFDLVDDSLIYRGLPARLEIERQASSTSDVWAGFSSRLSVAALESGLPDASLSFNEGDLNQDYIPYGLDLSSESESLSEQAIVVYLSLKPTDSQSLGESVVYRIERTLPVESRLPYLSLTAGAFTRGTEVDSIDLTIGNPSESSIHLDLDNASSPAVLLKLLDTSGNVLAQSKVNIADRTVSGLGTVTLTSLSLNVPENAPATAILQAELSRYSAPETGQDFAPESPVATRLAVSTTAISYQTEISGFEIEGIDYANDVSTAVSTSGQSPLIIQGRAFKQDGVTLSTASLVVLSLQNGSYKRTYNLITDASGAFSYSFLPTGSEPGGTYSVWVKHPDLTRKPTERPEYAEFFYKRIVTTPSSFTVRIPRNYKQTLPIELSWPNGLALTDLQVQIVDYLGDPLDAAALTAMGLSATLEPVLATPGTTPDSSGFHSLKLKPSIKGILPAPTDGSGNTLNEAAFVCRVSASVDGQSTTLKDIPVYCYFAETFGQLSGPSKLIELGVLRDESAPTVELQNDSANISFKNSGLLPLTGLSFELVEPVTNEQGSVIGYKPAPAWARLIVPSTRSLDVGASIQLQLETRFDAANSVLPAELNPYPLEVHAKTNEAALSRAQILTKVSTDANSTLEIHAVNIFYGYDPTTLTGDTSGVSVPPEYANGIQGATVTLQKDDTVDSVWAEPTILSGTTGSDAKVIFGDDEILEPGRYQMTVKAPKHETYRGTVWIKPGLDHFEQVALTYGTVTVEWEVKEITIEDRYEVNVETTFETSVPAPVLLISPAAIALPAMCPGDVYEVELLVENKGILAAQDFKNPIPASDEYLRVEPITVLPDRFDVPAQESIRVAFRYICLKALPNSECAE